MKNSGVEWIGEIPDDWEVRKILNCLRKRISDGPHETPKYVETGIPFISVDSLNDTEYVDFSFVNRFISDEDYFEYNKKTNLEENDILFSKAATIGKTAIVHADEKFMVWSPIAILKTNNSLDNRFLYFLLNYDGLITHISYLGSINTQINVGMRELEQARIPLPPKETQQHIASYLDKKCSKIEETIQNQQRVIEKLKAYKQSLITEAVTGKVKIVNGKACAEYESYKDSGVEWIGKIPREWVCVQIKNIFRFLGGYAFNSEDYVDETEYQILRIGNVKDFKILFDASPVYISKETAFQVENFKLRPGYILFTMTGTRGKKDYFYTHEITKDDCKKKNLYLNQRVGCLIPKTDIDSSYFNYLLKDNLIKDSVFLNETGTANQANIGSEDVMKIKVHCPPKEAQKEIASYLDKKCTVIDTAIEQKQNLIEKLTEYKKSLIYECVTGKKAV